MNSVICQNDFPMPGQAFFCVESGYFHVAVPFSRRHIVKSNFPGQGCFSNTRFLPKISSACQVASSHFASPRHTRNWRILRISHKLDGLYTQSCFCCGLFFFRGLKAHYFETGETLVIFDLLYGNGVCVQNCTAPGFNFS